MQTDPYPTGQSVPRGSPGPCVKSSGWIVEALKVIGDSPELQRLIWGALAVALVFAVAKVVTALHF